MEIDLLTGLIIGKAIEVHKCLGPGLLENVYQECLNYELNQAGIRTEKEKILPFYYKSLRLERGYRIDLLVENKVVIEIKTVEALRPAHISQMLTYLKLGDYRVGLIINFNVKILKHGIKRMVNGHHR